MSNRNSKDGTTADSSTPDEVTTSAPLAANPMLAAVVFTREYLIDICKKAIVDVSKWDNRDSPSSQENTGKLWALLNSNCEFEILFDEEGLCTNERTIWVRIWLPKFSHFDWQGFNLKDRNTLEDEVFYLPTISRLNVSNGNDWY